MRRYVRKNSGKQMLGKYTKVAEIYNKKKPQLKNNQKSEIN